MYEKFVKYICMILVSCDTVQRWKRSELSQPNCKNFENKVGMGVVLKFVTLDGDLRKKNKKNFHFLQKWLNFKTFFG